MNMIKNYLAYSSKKVFMAAYVLFPIMMIAMVWILELIFGSAEPSFQATFSIITMVWTMIVICISDRFSIGTILVNNSQINEIAKTSPVGEKLTQNVVKWDIFMRLILIILTIAGVFSSELLYWEGGAMKFILKVLLAISVCHSATSLFCWVCRKIENMTISTIIYSFGTLYMLPYAFIIVAFNKIPITVPVISMIVFTAADILINAFGVKLTKRFIKNEWYKDTVVKGR